MRNHPLGIYEKALAKDLSWPERLVLAKSCGFDFVEMSGMKLTSVCRALTGALHKGLRWLPR